MMHQKKKRGWKVRILNAERYGAIVKMHAGRCSVRFFSIRSHWFGQKDQLIFKESSIDNIDVGGVGGGRDVGLKPKKTQSLTGESRKSL